MSHFILFCFAELFCFTIMRKKCFFAHNLNIYIYMPLVYFLSTLSYLCYCTPLCLLSNSFSFDDIIYENRAIFLTQFTTCVHINMLKPILDSLIRVHARKANRAHVACRSKQDITMCNIYSFYALIVFCKNFLLYSSRYLTKLMRNTMGPLI